MRTEPRYEPLPSDPEGSNQTTKYQPLPLVDLNASATYADPLLAQARPQSWVASSFPPLTLRDVCGKQRSKLRDAFNNLECDALILMDRYDVDKSGYLDAQELKRLLTQYSESLVKYRREVSDEDIQYILNVADVNLDGTIDESEVMLGIKVWFAYNNMPKRVNSTLLKHGVSARRPLPPVEVIAEILARLNDKMPVQHAEAVFVRQMALALGSTEQDASSDQVRRAIATWYLNVERSDTGALDLAQHVLANSSSEVVSMVPFDRIAIARENEPHDGFGLHVPDCLSRYRCVWCIAGVLLLLFCFIPKGEPTCEHDLHMVVLMLAVLWTLQLATRVLALLSEAGASIGSCIIGVLQICVCFLGFFDTVRSSSEKCGGSLYVLCVLLFVVLPLTSCCCGCMLSLLTMTMSIARWREMTLAEQRLQDREENNSVHREKRINEICAEHEVRLKEIRSMPVVGSNVYQPHGEDPRILAWVYLMQFQCEADMHVKTSVEEKIRISDGELQSALFDRYDGNKSGGLDKHEMKLILRDIIKAVSILGGKYHTQWHAISVLNHKVLGNSADPVQHKPLESNDPHVYSATGLTGEVIVGFGEGRRAEYVRCLVASVHRFPIKRVQLLSASGGEIADNEELSSNVQVVLIPEKDIPDELVQVAFDAFSETVASGDIEQGIFNEIPKNKFQLGVFSSSSIFDKMRDKYEVLVQKEEKEERNIAIKRHIKERCFEKFDEFAAPEADAQKVLKPHSFQKLAEHCIRAMFSESVAQFEDRVGHQPIVKDLILPVVLEEVNRVDLTEITTALEFAFAHMDANKDGMLERKEIDVFCDKITERFMEASNEAELKDAFLDELFTFVDQNGDGSISVDEAERLIEALGQIFRFLIARYIDVLISLTRSAPIEDFLVEKVGEADLFKRLDENSDGVITKAELEKVLQEEEIPTKVSAFLEEVVGSRGALAKFWNAALGARMHIAGEERSFTNKLFLQALTWKDGGIDEATFIRYVVPLMEEHMANEVDASWLNMDTDGKPNAPANMFWSLTIIPPALTMMVGHLRQEYPQMLPRIMESAKMVQAKLKDHIPEVCSYIFKLLDLDSSGVISHREVGVLKSTMDAVLRLGTVVLIDSGAELSTVEAEGLQSLYPDLFEKDTPWPTLADEVLKLFIAIFDIIDRDGDERLERNELIMFVSKTLRTFLFVARMYCLISLESVIALCKGVAVDFWDYCRKCVRPDGSGNVTAHANTGITKEDFAFLFGDAEGIMALWRLVAGAPPERAEVTPLATSSNLRATEHDAFADAHWATLPSVGTWLSYDRPCAESNGLHEVGHTATQ